MIHACSVMSDPFQPYGLHPVRPLSMGFSRQEYWSGLPCPPPRDLPDPGIECRSLPSLGLADSGRLQSMGLLRVRHDWVTSLSLFTFMHWRRKWQPTPVFLPGASQGWGSLEGCRLWGHAESDTTEVTQQQQQLPLAPPGKPISTAIFTNFLHQFCSLSWMALYNWQINVVWTISRKLVYYELTALEEKVTELFRGIAWHYCKEKYLLWLSKLVIVDLERGRGMI